jgi:hypothetical protein
MAGSSSKKRTKSGPNSFAGPELWRVAQYVRARFGDESGQAIMVVAVFLGLFLLGVLAIGLDVGLLFHQKRMAQAAADAAAVAAAEEAVTGNSGNEQTVANAIAKLNGFDTTLNKDPATVTLRTPTSGSYAGSSTYVEAIVAKPVPTVFLSAFERASTKINVSARAVAGGGLSSPTCICVEAPTGQGLAMSNNAQILAPQCGVTVDSSSGNAVGITGSATLEQFRNTRRLLSAVKVAFS